jgi:hypothetical protein
MLSGDGQWTTYEPKATFKSTDGTGYRGEKIFEQPLIATQAGTHAIPSLSFSYFDPGTRRYETARSAPLNITVSPAADNSGGEAPPVASAKGTAADEAHTGLRPDHAASGARVDTLTPLYFQPRFLSIPSVLALLLAAGWAALRRRDRNAIGTPLGRLRARTQLTHALLEQMSSAAAAGNAALFFNAARSALRHTLGARWEAQPEQITLADIDARLEESGDKNYIRKIFALADEANFSGDDMKATDFERWTEIVRRQLAAESAAETAS